MTKPTPKNKKLLGIILTTIFAISLFTTFSQISFAAPTPAPAPKTPAEQQYDIKNLKYNVNKNLKLPGSTTGKDDQQPKSYFSDKTNTPIVSFILSIINYATAIIGTIAMIIFIIAGFMFMLAQGDQTKIDKAKEAFKYAIYGLLITFLSYVVVIFVQSLFITQSVNTAATKLSTTATTPQ